MTRDHKTATDAARELNALDTSCEFAVGDRVEFTSGDGVTHTGTIMAAADDGGRVSIVEAKNGHRWTRFPSAWVVAARDDDPSPRWPQRVNRVGVLALALGALWAGGSDLAVEQAAASPILTEVVRETERAGWPHQSTWQERSEASYAVLASQVSGRQSGGVRCFWPSGRMGAFHCGVVKSAPSRRRVAYRVNVQVWEDGSYRITRAAGVSR